MEEAEQRRCKILKEKVTLSNMRQVHERKRAIEENISDILSLMSNSENIWECIEDVHPTSVD